MHYVHGCPTPKAPGTLLSPGLPHLVGEWNVRVFPGQVAGPASPALVGFNSLGPGHASEPPGSLGPPRERELTGQWCGAGRPFAAFPDTPVWKAVLAARAPQLTASPPAPRAAPPCQPGLLE